MATVNYSWNLPTVGGSEDTWGTSLNANWTDLDALLGGVSQTEFAILDGATVTTAELNILDGVTALTGSDTEIVTGTAGTDGQIGKWNADGDLIGVGTNTANGDVVVLEDVSGNPGLPAVDGSQLTGIEVGGLDFLATADASNDATIDFTAFDATKYDAYLFVFANVIPATDGGDLYARVSSNGGSSYDSGASDYTGVRVSISDSSDGSGGGSDSVLFLINNNGSDTGEDGVSGHFFVFGPHLSKKTQFSARFTHVRNDGDFRIADFGGVREAASAIDAIRFYFHTGNVESGTITMYGLRNA